MSGGISNIKGVDYQLWYCALELTNTFFNENRIVKPEAILMSRPHEEITEKDIIEVDDIYVRENGEDYYFNIKYECPPSYSQWTVSALEKVNVLSQLKSEYEKNPNGKLIFVSQSPANILKRVFDKVQNCNTSQEVEFFLKTKDEKYSKEWENLKKYFDYSDEELIMFSRQLEFRIFPLSNIKETIESKLKDSLTNYINAPAELRQFASSISSRENSQVDRHQIIEYLKSKEIFRKSHIPSSIINKFKTASSEIKNCPNQFGNLVGSKLDRKETLSIIEWIEGDLLKTNSSALLLVSRSGFGKTTILKNVVEGLESKRIPVLGIKADNFINFQSMDNILNELGIEKNIEQIIVALSESNERVVVVIDQLDALSQYLAANKSALKTFKRFINRIINNSPSSKVRVILSCRIFDLENDPDIVELKSQISPKIIYVSELTNEEIKSILALLKVDFEVLPDKLIELLRVPLHLSIFCEIYHEELELMSINSVEDLYEKLWEKKIDYPSSFPQGINPQDLENTIFTIAEKMYEVQDLQIPTKLLIGKNKQFKFLISQGILNKQNQSIKFFHQSFYDYAYARYFLSRASSLSEHILNNHQGLFTRARIRFILNYLRSRNPKIHQNEIRYMLTAPNCRFHIKVLIIQILGNEKLPNAKEKKLVKEIIFSNELFMTIFIESINSLKWFQFLKEKDYLINYFNNVTIKPETSNKILPLFFRIVKNHPNEVLNFFRLLPKSQYTQEFILYILTRLEDWSNDLSIDIYNQFLGDFNFDNFADHKTSILENAYQSQKEWVTQLFLDDIDVFNEEIRREINNGNTFLNALRGRETFPLSALYKTSLEQIFKDSPNAKLELGLKLLKKIIHETKFEENVNSDLYLDFGFYFEHSGASDHKFLFKEISNQLQRIAIEEREKFKLVAKDLIQSKSISQIQLAIDGFLKDPEVYFPEIFNVIQLLKKNQLLNSNNRVSYQIRIAIKNTFKFFNQHQKNWIVYFIKKITDIHENRIVKSSNGKKLLINDYGLLKLYYIRSLPEEIVKSDQTLNKQYQELKRKFNHNPTDKKPNKLGPMLRPVSSPIPVDAFPNISFKKIKYILKNSESSHPNVEVGNFALADGFSRAIRKHSQILIPIFEKLVDEDIPMIYKIFGFETIINNHVDFEVCLRIFKRLIKEVDFKSKYVYSLVQKVEFFATRKYMDEDIFNFLEKCALYYSQSLENIDNNVESLLEISFNTISGRAINILTYINYDEKYKSRIFSALNSIADSNFLHLKCAAIWKIAYLTHLDKNESLKIFLTLTKEFDKNIYETSRWSAATFAKIDFKAMIPYFKNAMKLKNYIHSDIGSILTMCWFKDQEGSFELLEEVCQESDKAKAGSLQAVFSKLKDSSPEIRQKCECIFLSIGGNLSREVASVLEAGLRDFPDVDFKLIKPFIEAYLKNTKAKGLPRGVVRYLEKNSHQYPLESINLMEKFEGFGLYEPYKTSSHSAPLSITIDAYQKFLEDDNSDYMEKAMDIFDNILKDEGVRLGAKYDRLTKDI